MAQVITMLTECVYGCGYGSIRDITTEKVYIIVVIENNVELETFEDDELHGYAGIDESFNHEIQVYGLAWRDNLLGVAQCTSHWERQAAF